MRTRKTLFALLMICWLGITEFTTLHASALARPLISATVNGSTVVLSYNSTSKVSGYEVTLSGTGSASKVVYTGSKTTVSITKVAIGSTLVFSVRSYTEVKKVKTYSDPVTLTVDVKLNAPVLMGKLSKSVGSLSWAKVIGAKGYEVYRSSTYSGPYTLVKTAVTLKFSEKLGVGVHVYYKVRSFITVNGQKVYSDYSNIVLISN
jgi:hypothetical protein